jgi:Domain of unknown function (DUF4142)
MRTHQLFRALPAAALASALGICLMGATNDAVSATDVNFAPSAMKMILQGAANAEAVQDGTADPSPDVTALAKSIQADCLAVGSELAQLADYDGIKVSTDLPKATGTNASFAQDQVTALSQLIAVLQSEKANGNAPNLRDFADNAIPRLQKDLDAAKAIH